MDVEEESDLSSSSSSYSSSEDESVGEEEDDDSEEEAPSGTKGAERGGEKQRRKRKRKMAGHRRDLRSKYDSVKDFNPEARSAQTEEVERIRRLELQRSLQAASPSVPGIVTGNDTDPTALLGRGPVFRNLAEEEPRESVEAIVISSDSEEEDERERLRGEEGRGVSGGRVGEGTREVKREEGRGGRYDIVGEERGEQVVINMGHPPDEEDVSLAPQIERIIKPHQVGGVRFLYDNLIESLSRFHTSTGFGCILAHSMGLGKTLQVIAFIDIFFRYTPAQHVLCVVPVNTLQNWVVEFDKWLPDKEKEEQRKRSNNVSSNNKANRTKNKRSTQNGRLSKMPDILQQTSSPSSSPQMYTNTLPSTLPTKDTVSMPTVSLDTGNNSQVFPGDVLSEADQQFLLSCLNSDPSNHIPPSYTSLSIPPTVNNMSGSHSHTLNPNTTNSRSHTASPSVPDVQYRNFKLFVLSETVRKLETRLKVIKQWRSEGGVLLIGYEMYRLLALSIPSLGGNKMAVKRRKTNKSQQQTTNNSFVDLDENEKEMEKLMEIQRALCIPGPDLVVCDEGHRIKNDYTNISQSLKKIQTRRRVVLTGYPLQNNLLEYWCMVDFVRPKYLGTKQEFCDLFERPISNGQCMDSTAKDVRTMRYRSHVLHTLLKGFVLRRGHEILKCTLPGKFEHVLFVRPSPVQAALYDFNMNTLQQGGTSSTAGPLKGFAVCTKIWNHPDIYYNEANKESKKGSSLAWLDEAGLPKNLLPKTETNKVEWPKEALAMLPPYQTGRLDNSPKMVVAMEIMDRSVQLGDKLLIFSQSLLSLSYIESLLVRRPIPIPHSAGPSGEVQYSGIMWTKNVNFCRLDGSTGSTDRDRLITAFNSPTNNEMWVFLLSTKAGCLGINLIGANRVIVLDVSWNPCYDAQAVCRVYRYGQTKPCHIYRVVCDGTMEKKIYDRQISKQGMADRVVDELQPERHFTADEIITLMRPLANLPAPQDFSFNSHQFMFDQVLCILCHHFGPLLTKLPFRHESLLLDSANEKMTDVEKFYAMRGFEQDWNARKRNIIPHVQRNTPISPQPPRQVGGTPSPVSAATIIPPHPVVSSSVSSLSVSPYSNTRMGVASVTLPSTNHTNYSPQSHSNFTSQQQSLESIPTTSGMGYGNVTAPATTSDIICLDSDNEVDWNQTSAVSGHMTSVGSHMTSVGSHMTSSQATLLPGPKVLTVPISSPSPGSTHFHAGHTHSSSSSTNVSAGHTSLAPTTGVGNPPLNAAVAQLIAYMRQGEVTDRVSGSGDIKQSGTSSNLISSSNFQPQSSFSNSLPSAISQPNQVSLSSSVGRPAQLGTESNPHEPAVNPGQFLGQSLLNSGQNVSSLGQTTSTLSSQAMSNHSTYHHSSINEQSSTPQRATISPAPLTNLPSRLTSLLQPTMSNVMSTPIHPPHHPFTSTQSSAITASSPLNSAMSLTQQSIVSPTTAPINPTNTDQRSQHDTVASSHDSLGSVTLTNPTQPGDNSQSHSGHRGLLDFLGSPPRPLFSPPKLPLSRELMASSSHSSATSNNSSRPPTQTVFSNNPFPVPSPQPATTAAIAPVSSPHPPPLSLPCSPLSQPPTPTTSIPLLSPVAAHFFQVSMSKSPKPSPSPSRTPTPSPSPSSSSHHHPITSPPAPLCSPASKKPASTHTTTHSGFHGNSTSDPHGNLSSSYGNSCVILQ